MIVCIVTTSEMFGRFSKETLSPNNLLAAYIGSAAFFAPQTTTVQ
jgi:hypothetical protein